MKKLTIILLVLCGLGIFYALTPILYPSQSRVLTVKDLTTGVVSYIKTTQPYSVGDTTYKLQVYGIVEEVN